MTRALFASFALILGLFAQISLASSDQSVIRSYQACMQYLRMSPAEQVRIARTSGYTLKQINWACELMKRNGLAKTIHGEHEYQHAMQSGGNGSVSHSSTEDTGPQSCNFSIQCRLDEHCIEGHCIEKIRQACEETGIFTCASGEKCNNGVCE